MCSPPSSTRARSTARTPPAPARQPRRPRHGGHRPARRAPVRHVVRRLAPAQAPFGEGSARAHVARCPPVLRRARGMFAPAAAASRPRTTASTSSASSASCRASTASSSTSCRPRCRRRRPSWTSSAPRASRRASTPSTASPTSSMRCQRATSTPTSWSPYFREDSGQGMHVFMVREGRIINSNEFVLDRGKDVPDDDLLHMFLLRYYDATTSIPHEVILRDEPEDKAAMEAWLTEKLASPYGARGAHHRAAEGREGRARGHGRDEREAHAHALQGAHELRRQAHQQRASAAGERTGSGRAAHAHRVLRHLHHPRLLHGGLDGGVHERQARQEPVPPLQDQDAARRGERLPVHAGGHEPPLRARAHGRRALRQQARPHHSRRRQAAAVGGARDVRADGHRRHRYVRSGQARRGAVRALAGHGLGGAAQRLGVAVPREAGATRRTASPSRSTASCAARA